MRLSTVGLGRSSDVGATVALVVASAPAAATASADGVDVGNAALGSRYQSSIDHAFVQ